MYELGTKEDFKKLIEELEERYKEESGDNYYIYPTHSELMYKSLKKYFEENFGEDESDTGV